MNTPTYLFYDLETSGLNKAFDQVLQFAAIRTDMALNELERHEFFIKVNPDVVVNPYAMITHQLPLDKIQQGLPEFIAIKKIHQLFNKPGTIGLGYNTLGFDDEFLRFSFYRNLLTPYTHQYANGCGRLDLYPMAVIYKLFKPDVIQWPDEGGGLKLEAINQKNNFNQGASHNAIIDVEVTLALAKAFYREKKTWDYLIGYFNKDTAQERLMRLPVQWQSDLGAHPLGLYVEGRLGAKQHYQAPVLGLGGHYHYRNQSVWLRLDKPDLCQATEDDFIKHCVVINKKLPEPGFILPPEPRFLKYFTDDAQAIIETNLAWLKTQPDFLKTIINYYCDYTYPRVDNLDIDAALYDRGFPERYDIGVAAKLHANVDESASEIIESFQDAGMRELAIRAIGRYSPNLLNANQQAEFNDYLESINQAESGVDYRGNPRYSKAMAHADIEKILASEKLSANQKQILINFIE